VKFTQTNVATLRAPVGATDHTEWDDGMPGFGIRFRDGGAGAYTIKFSLHGKQVKLGLGKVNKVALVAAKTEAQQHFAKIAKGINPALERATVVVKAASTLDQMIPAFLAYLAQEGRAESYLAENTRSLTRYFKALHPYNASDVTRLTVANELAKISKEHGPFAAARSRAHLSKFYSWAIGEGRAENNPGSGTNKATTKTRDRILSDAELAKIWDECPADEDYGRIIMLLMLTGCRRDEIASLSRSEIKADHLDLPGRRTKNKKRFLVPLSPQALAILNSIKPRADSDFVFGRGDGGFSGWSQSKARLDARLASSNEGTGFNDWVPHDMRRTFSTTMNDRGTAPHVVEACLNHIVGGVAGVYNHAKHLKEKREALDQWGEHISAIVHPRPKLRSVS
jgi:integrase